MSRSTRERLASASSLGALRAILSSAIALTAPACAHDAPSAPRSVAVSPSHSVVRAPGQSNIGEALADASARLVPSVANAATRAQLDGSLRDLAAQLDAGDVVKARNARLPARKALAASAKLEGGEQADLAAIGLALDQVENSLKTDGAIAQP